MIEPLSSKDWLQGVEILFIHGGNTLQTEVDLREFATGGAINRINILGGPDELLQGTTAVSSDSVNVVLCERAPVGSNNRGATKEGFNRHPSKGLIVMRRGKKGLRPT